MKNKKSSTWQLILGIAAAIIVMFIIYWGMKKAGVFSNETMAAIKNKFNPFG